VCCYVFFTSPTISSFVASSTVTPFFSFIFTGNTIATVHNPRYYLFVCNATRSPCLELLLYCLPDACFCQAMSYDMASGHMGLPLSIIGCMPSCLHCGYLNYANFSVAPHQLLFVVLSCSMTLEMPTNNENHCAHQVLACLTMYLAQ